MEQTDEDDVSISEMSDEEIMEAIQKDGTFIKYVEQTPDRCLAAVRQDGRALGAIAEELRTKELCMASAERDGSGVMWIPHEFLTFDLCMMGVRVNPYVFEDLPAHFKTSELCLEAVKHSPRTLRFIPKGMQTEEICLEAIRNGPNALRYVSKKLLTNEIYLAAVMKSGGIIRDVPDEFKTEKLCVHALVQLGKQFHTALEDRSTRFPDTILSIERSLLNIPKKMCTDEFYLKAVQLDGRALHCVPEKMCTQEMCEIAVEGSGLSLYSVPTNKLTKKLCLNALKQDGRALDFVPPKMRDEECCIAAVNSQPLALEYVPEKLKTKALCEIATVVDWKAFAFVMEEMYTVDNCIEVYERMLGDQESPLEISYRDKQIFRKVLKHLSEKENEDIRIFELRKRFDERSFKKKMYDKEKKSFIAEERFTDEIKEFGLFDEFYKFLYGNLNGADLRDFDFEGVDIKKYDWGGAHINTETLEKNSLYDDTFYTENLKELKGDAEQLFSLKNEVVEASAVLHETDLMQIVEMNKNTNNVYYVSDIHLDHKLQKKFPERATEQEIEQYIEHIVEEMVGGCDMSHRNLLLVAGDVSYNLKISTIFFKKLRRAWWRDEIIAVLGNHELWGRGIKNLPQNNTERLEKIIHEYRSALNYTGIKFLHNDLLFSNGEILSEEKLLSMGQKELKEKCLKSSYIILGGVGYSGINSEFNAACGIYSETITSLDEDIEQTKRFETVYKKVKESIGDRQVIILTHMPKENWSDENYHSNWIYLNGHTHLNEYYCNDEKTVYADNQVGYHSESIGLKRFSVSGEYDTYMYYPDGKYVISKKEYEDFNRGKRIKMTFNEAGGKITMLKNQGTYCFIFEYDVPGKLYLLNGGTKKKLENSDVNYYFEKMANYSGTVKGSLKEYQSTLKSISDGVKKIGGTGRIHGCIIDIDFFNHLFLNPVDGKVTPYYATSVVNKMVYPDIKSLLMSKRQDIYENYVKFLESDNKDTVFLGGKGDVGIINVPRYVPETDIYGLSRIMRSIQYLTDNNVIRIWDEDVANRSDKNIINSLTQGG